MVTITGTEIVIGSTFTDRDILWEALQAPGSGILLAGTRQITDGNKRLALIGDSILKLVILEDRYMRGLARGQCDRDVQRLVANRNLQEVGRMYGLGQFINQNPSTYGVVSPRTMADTVEAIIGAVYLDGGLEALRPVLGTLGLV